MKRRNHGLNIGIGLALVVAGGLVVLVASRGATPRQNAGVDSHGQAITKVRTVLLSAAGPVGVSIPGQPLRAELLSGNMPSKGTMATVLSDENCTPDAQGVSHCTNRMRMEDGSEMTVTHPHRMADVPCLSPGERVSVEVA